MWTLSWFFDEGITLMSTAVTRSKVWIVKRWNLNCSWTASIPDVLRRNNIELSQNSSALAVEMEIVIKVVKQHQKEMKYQRAYITRMLLNDKNDSELVKNKSLLDVSKIAAQKQPELMLSACWLLSLHRSLRQCLMPGMCYTHKLCNAMTQKKV